MVTLHVWLGQRLETKAERTFVVTVSCKESFLEQQRILPGTLANIQHESFRNLNNGIYPCHNLKQVCGGPTDDHGAKLDSDVAQLYPCLFLGSHAIKSTCSQQYLFNGLFCLRRTTLGRNEAARNVYTLELHHTRVAVPYGDSSSNITELPFITSLYR
jgi:hypothetical protein